MRKLHFLRHFLCLFFLFAMPVFASDSVLEPSFVSQVLAFIIAHQAVVLTIIGALVPSLLTFLTSHPTAFTPAALALVQLFCARFSVLEHSDSASGVLKFPLAAATPSDHPEAIVLGSARGFARLSVLLALAAACIVVSASGCSLFKPTLASDEKACAQTALSELESDALGDITRAVTSAPADWQATASADALAAVESLGPAAICALEALAHDYDPSPAPTSATPPATATSPALMMASGSPNANASGKVAAARIRALLATLRARKS